MTLKSKIESLLFVAGKPLTAKKIAELIDSREEEVSKAMVELIREYDERQGGLKIFSTGRSFQLGTAGENAGVIETFVKEEFSSDLTRPQLETLTVIAYRGPLSKGELEIIRGVSCGLILRNLAIRGLIDEEYDTQRKEIKYRVSMDFLRHLGVTSVNHLLDYEKLHAHEILQTLLSQQNPKT